MHYVGLGAEGAPGPRSAAVVLRHPGVSRIVMLTEPSAGRRCRAGTGGVAVRRTPDAPFGAATRPSQRTPLNADGMIDRPATPGHAESWHTTTGDRAPGIPSLTRGTAAITWRGAGLTRGGRQSLLSGPSLTLTTERTKAAASIPPDVDLPTER